MRLLLAALLLFASCITAAAQGCGNTNPNCIVPTAPPGTSDNRAASTAFVQSSAAGSPVKGPTTSTIGDIATWNNGLGTLLADPASVSTGQNVYFGSGQPWCDVRAKGATATAGTTNIDDTAAFTACQTAMPSGGIIYVPLGHYCLTSGFTISTGGIRLIGAGRNAAILEACGGDTAPVVTSSATQSTIENLTIWGKGSPNDANDTTFGATNAALNLTSGASSSFLNNITVYGGHYNIQSSALINMYSVVGGYAYQNEMQLSGGAFVNDSSADQNWPTTPPAAVSLASVSAYANNTSYTAGQIVSLGGYIIQAMTSGTSMSSSSPTLKNFTATISDNGTLTWQLVASTTGVAWNISGSNSEFYAKFLDATGGMQNGITIGGGQFKCYACLAGQTINAPVAVTGGSLVEFGDLSTGYPIIQQVAGVIATNTFTGVLTVTGGNILGDYGLIINGGNLVMTGGFVIGKNFYGISIAASLTKQTIVGTDFSGSSSCVNFSSGMDFIKFIADCGSTTITGSAGPHSVVISDGTITDSVSLTSPAVNGGNVAGSTLTLASTTSGAPSGDSVSIKGSNVNITSVSGGTVVANIGAANTVGASVNIAGSASGAQIWQPAAAASGTITWPAGVVDFSSTGGTSQVVKQTSSGGIFTVGQLAFSDISGTLAVAKGGTGQTSIAGIQATTNQGLLTFEISGVNFNSANTDNAINITLPTGFSRYRILSMTISGASASISAATFGVFSGTGGTGTVLVNSGTAITVTASAENTANNMQFITVNNNNSASYNFSSIQFRVVGAQGSAATANVAISIQPVS